MRNNGDSRREESNKELEEFNRLITKLFVEYKPESASFVTEAMSKFKKMRLKEDRKKKHFPEVD